MPEVLSTALGLRPRAVLRPRGTVSSNTDQPRPVKNIFIFFQLRFKSFRKIYFSLQPMCVEEGHVRVDVMHMIDCKSKQNITT